MARPQTVYLIDGSAQLHRAYFAIKGLATTRGLPTNAVYGFTTMLRKLYEDEEPEWVGISFDLPGATFRHEQYTEYKAGRSKSPDEFKGQISLVKEVLEALRIPTTEIDGWEADDIIATLATQASEQGFEVLISSGDRDAFQLVSDHVTVLYPRRGVSDLARMTPAAVAERYFATPAR